MRASVEEQCQNIAARIIEINQKIGELKTKLSVIPGEIESIEDEQRRVRAKAVEKAKHLHEEQDIRGSTEYVKRMRMQLAGMSRNIEAKWEERVNALDEIAKLEKEKKELEGKKELLKSK